MTTARPDKELLDATKAFIQEDRARSWRAFWSTLLFLLASLAATIPTPDSTSGWIIRALASLLAGLFIVRFFILYHDFQHGAILRQSKLARAIFGIYGIYIMTPPPVWRETHNYHHANTAKIIGSHVGSYATVTTGMWAKMSKKERLMYKLIRHPLTILSAYFTVFMLGMAVSPLLRQPRKHWLCGLSLLVNWTASGLIIWKAGFFTFLFAYFLPLAISMCIGAYLFYAQHNFPDTHIQPRESWSYTKAALESSSYMKMGPVMRYFTGNIGYHHVHHLSSMIPFYRLPEAMAAIPELRNPPTTSLAIKDIMACFAQKLWDPEKGKMVGYPDDDETPDGNNEEAREQLAA
jgi:omega-6 fatty acid desaturase (delta-12 desaturase)